MDTVRAFHFGDKFLVELHIVLDETLPLREAHDVGEKLEMMVENIDDVERCFVHVSFSLPWQLLKSDAWVLRSHSISLSLI